jgi:cytochrome P450
MGRASDKVAGKAAAAPLEQMLFLDGAAHERARRPIAAAISQAQRSFPAMLSPIIDRALEGLAEETQIDLVRDYASKISLQAISIVIGIEPAADGLRELAEAVFGFFISASSKDSVERGRHAFDELVTMMVEHVHELRSADIDERGIFTSFVHKDRPHMLSTKEWGVQLAGLFVAGSLTTADLIASACLVLIAFPDIKEAILRDGALIHGLVEEVLRLEPPSTFSYRIATRGGSVAGCPYGKGEILYTSISSANRDKLIFEHPDQINLGRRAAHLTFGGGAHFCPGAPLARIEAVLAIGALFERYPDIAYASPQPPEWSTSPHRCALLTLPVAKGLPG